ncbi:MAG TPA: type II toxin-antitoxin system RelE/ParE family toxin [Puia sp.]|nr:type II toxin-antitoxin system RelE/ParE family toxin [Puia sp.]
MSYKVKSISAFERQAKRLIKKCHSLQKELLSLVQDLKENRERGTSLGNNCYKIRLSISSKGKGKSGGARIITNIVIADEIVYLLSIYDKSEQGDISNKELQELLKEVP